MAHPVQALPDRDAAAARLEDVHPVRVLREVVVAPGVRDGPALPPSGGTKGASEGVLIMGVALQCGQTVSLVQ